MILDIKKTYRILFVLFLVLWLIGELYISKLDNIKYIPLVIMVLIGILSLRKKKKMYGYEIKQILYIFLTFAFISIFFQILNKNILIETYKELFLFILPGLIAFCIFNVEKEDRSFYFDMLFIVLCIKFILSFGSDLSIESIKSISFTNSYSPFESSDAAIFLPLYTLFFLRKNKTKCILAGIFTILSFKRLDVIYVLLFPIIMMFVDKNKTVNKKIIKILKITFIISPFLIEAMLEDSFARAFYNYFKIDFNKFTMGRFDIINYIVDINLTNYGLGTTTSFLESNPINGITNMHCDLLRIYIETSIFGLIFFVNNMFNIVKNNTIACILMTFCFFVLFTSHCLTVFMIWLAMYLVIFELINKEKSKID